MKLIMNTRDRSWDRSLDSLWGYFRNFSRVLPIALLATATGLDASAGDWPWPEPAENSVSGSNSLTLAQAVTQAQSTSPEVREAQAEAASASWKKLDALSDHLPHLEVDAFHFFTQKYEDLKVVFGPQTIVFPEGVPQDNVDINASVLLFDGFAGVNRYRAALYDSEAADLHLQREKFRVEGEVRIRFQRALANQALLGVADENIKSLEDHLSQAQLLAKNGYSTRFDVLRVQAQLEESRAAKLVTLDDVAQARRDLARLLGVSGLPPQLLGELPVPDSHAVSQELKLDPSQRDDLEALRRHEKAVDLRSTADSVFWVPKVTLFGDLVYYKFGDFDPVILPTPWANAYSFGIRATWNIFDGGKSYAKDREAGEELKKQLEQERAASLDAFDELDNWKRRYLYNTALYEARTRTVEEGLESVRLAAIGQKAGTRTSTERLDAELELFQARAGLVRAQADADEAILRLELAAGHRIGVQH